MKAEAVGGEKQIGLSPRAHGVLGAPFPSLLLVEAGTEVGIMWAGFIYFSYKCLLPWDLWMDLKVFLEFPAFMQNYVHL